MENRNERMNDMENRSVADEKNLELLADDVQRLEKQLLPQLDLLAEKIPEIYGGYASMVREIINVSLSVLNPRSATASKLSVAAEIGVRGLQAYGAYKAAKKHNEMLDKFLVVKREIANLNYAKVSDLLPKVRCKLESSGLLFDKIARNQYLLHGEDQQTIIRVSNLVLRVLTLYRTNLFLMELCSYLEREYRVWLSGSQTSEMRRPDYYKVNGVVVEKLFGKRAFVALEKAADGNGDLLGKELMLIADPQLFAFTMKDQLCEIDVSQASPAVRVLMEFNSGCKYYTDTTDDLRRHVRKTPYRKVAFLRVALFAVLLSVGLIFADVEPWISILVGAIATGAIIRFVVKNLKRARINHVVAGMAIVEDTDRNMETFCGKTEEIEIDYDRKNTGMAAISAFLGGN